MLNDIKLSMSYEKLRIIMKKIYFLFALLFFICDFKEVECKQLKINLVSHKNGHGLEADQKILGEALEQLGQQVNYLDFFDFKDTITYADINIFFELLIPDIFPFAVQNWFIPNPECYISGPEALAQVNLVLCRTRDTERIFKELNKETYFLGFTSFDCYQPEIEKNFSFFFHLAGASPWKGTATVMDIWSRNPLFPLLTVIKRIPPIPSIVPFNVQWIDHHLDQNSLRYLQNISGIHICISEAEGFGHYIMEAMSTGAVVITTNAPPMNEFIKDSRCLIPYYKSEKRQLGTGYYAIPSRLEFLIKYLLTLSTEELKQIGDNNRFLYLEKTIEFKKNLRNLILDLN